MIPPLLKVLVPVRGCCPAHYVEPLGTPLYWRNELTELAPAIEAYLNFTAGLAPQPPSPDQVARVAWYCHYFVMAPCWTDCCAGEPRMEADLAELRERAKTLGSIEAVRRWMFEALDCGIDVL